MGIYNLTFDVLGSFGGEIPKLNIYYGGKKLAVKYAYSSNTPVSLEIDTDGFAYNHSLLRFYFVKGSGADGDSIEVSNIKLDNDALDINNFEEAKGGTVTSDSLVLGKGEYIDYNAQASGDITDTQYVAPQSGAKVQAVITGTTGDDRPLYGTNEAGGDVIDALAGDDKVIAADGNDTVNAGDGNDYVSGGNGDDILNGNAGNDKMYGGNGDDTLDGGIGADKLYGNNGNDTINGGDGNDTLYGNAGQDTLDGGAGDDNISGGADNDTLYAGAGNDQLFGGDGDDVMYGGNDNDRMLGNAGNDTMYGDSGNDNIDGQEGDDTIYGGSGSDTIDGEEGNDTLLGDGGDDYIIGGQGADILTGGAGNDVMYGGGISSYDQYVVRNSSIYGTSGVWFSEQTQSFYRFVNTNIDFATAEAEAASATLNGVAGELVTITSQAENDFLENMISVRVWTSGQDLGEDGSWEWTSGIESGITFSNNSGNAINNMYESWDSGQPQVNTEFNTVLETNGAWHDWSATTSKGYVIEWNADEIIADNSADILNGGAGNDQLYGGAGDDTLNGGDDNDILYGQEGNDTISGDAGNDVIIGDSRAEVIGQTGQVTTNQVDGNQWHSITFDAVITNPVIKLALNTTNGDDPVTLRVRNVTDTGFEWQMDEYEYLTDGGAHDTETISWMAVAAGTHTLDNGAVIQANLTTVTNNDFTNVSFNSAFGSSPVIMTQIMTDNDSTAAVLHNENRTSSGFRVQLEEQESFDTAHGTETVGWIAIDNGGSVANGFLVGETGNNVTDATSTVNFGGDFASLSPVVLIDQQTEDGGDTALSRGISISSNSISFNIDEETSRDSETTHTTEIVGYYATTAGLLYASGDSGDDIISGGAGSDTLYGGGGADTFIFEAASAFSDVDTIEDFVYGQGDTLDISDLISGFSGNVSEYVQLVNSGSDTLVQVDSNGGADSFQTIAELSNVTDLDATLLYNNGGIVI